MTIKCGRDMFNDRRTAPRHRPLDAATLRRSGIARGSVLFRAARGDREAQAALDVIAGEEGTDLPPPPAA